MTLRRYGYPPTLREEVLEQVLEHLIKRDSEEHPTISPETKAATARLGNNKVVQMTWERDK